MACCCGGNACGCPSVPFPSSFNVTFSNFAFNFVEAIDGSANGTEPNLLKTFIEGLSPMIVPRRSINSANTSADYSRLECSEYNTPSNCNNFPPGFFAWSPIAGIRISTLALKLNCDGSAVTDVDARLMPAGSWRIRAEINGGDFEIFLQFASNTLFVANDVCNITSQQISATVVPSQRIGGFISSRTFLRRYSPFSYLCYSGAGNVSLNPVFNPLP